MLQLRSLFVSLFLISAPAVLIADLAHAANPAECRDQAPAACTGPPSLELSGVLMASLAEKAAASPSPGMRIRADGDFLALEIATAGFLTPWLGAGFDENGDGDGYLSSYRFGAGFACNLGRLVRLQLGYSYFSEFNLGSGDSAVEDDEEWHNFTVGLQRSF